MYKTLFNTITRKSLTLQSKACFAVPSRISSYHKNYRRDLERVAYTVGHTAQDLTHDQSNLSYNVQQLFVKLEKLANLDPKLKKILSDYSTEISTAKKSRMSNLTAQRLFECNFKVHHYLTATVGTQELRFLSIVNSDLADECSMINKELKKHIFST